MFLDGMVDSARSAEDRSRSDQSSVDQSRVGPLFGDLWRHTLPPSRQSHRVRHSGFRRPQPPSSNSVSGEPGLAAHQEQA